MKMMRLESGLLAPSMRRATSAKRASVETLLRVSVFMTRTDRLDKFQSRVNATNRRFNNGSRTCSVCVRPHSRLGVARSRRREHERVQPAEAGGVRTDDVAALAAEV